MSDLIKILLGLLLLAIGLPAAGFLCLGLAWAWVTCGFLWAPGQPECTLGRALSMLLDSAPWFRIPLFIAIALIVAIPVMMLLGRRSRK